MLTKTDKIRSKARFLSIHAISQSSGQKTHSKEYGDSPVIFDCSHVENEVKQYEVLDGQGIEIDQEGHVVILGERESEPIKGPWFIFGFRGTDSVSQPHLSSDSPEMEYSDD